MKNKIILGIILIAILFGLCGCSGEAKTQERFVTVYSDYPYEVYVDTKQM